MCEKTDQCLRIEEPSSKAFGDDHGDVDKQPDARDAHAGVRLVGRSQVGICFVMVVMAKETVGVCVAMVMVMAMAVLARQLPCGRQLE